MDREREKEAKGREQDREGGREDITNNKEEREGCQEG